MTESLPRVIVVGTSWGGLDALTTLLGALPDDLAAPIVVAQHRAPESHPTAFQELLQRITDLTVCEPSDKDDLRAGFVYLAPADYHLMVEGTHLELSVDERVGYSRPSIDVLFESAADAYRDRCIGVVMTGANADGARGLARIGSLGGTAIVQDPATAERPEMPAAALAAVPEARVAAVEEIGAILLQLCGRNGAEH